MILFYLVDIPIESVYTDNIRKGNNMPRDRQGNVVCDKCGCLKEDDPFLWCHKCMTKARKDKEEK